MEISFEAWEGVQRHGQDIADRLAQGFTGLLQAPPHFPWPPVSHNHKRGMPFEIDLPVVPFGVRGAGKDFFPTAAVASVIDIGGRLGQAGVEIGTSVGGAVQHAVRQLPVPFRSGQIRRRKLPSPPIGEGVALDRAVDRCPLEAAAAAAAAATGSAAASSVSGVAGGDDLDEDDEGYGCEIGTLGNFKKAKGTVNMSATYNTRNHDVESSVVARGDLWRLEASRSGSTSGNDSSPLYLVQLGPLLFVRDSTLLLPVHLSKQHLLWYGYDRKNGVHSLCPAIWSKQRRWLMMSMMCLNPIACSFMDLQFPNGQVTYVAGEGITASGFVPLLGGLLQAHGKFPGETRMSFSCKVCIPRRSSLIYGHQCYCNWRLKGQGRMRYKCPGSKECQLVKLKLATQKRKTWRTSKWKPDVLSEENHPHPATDFASFVEKVLPTSNLSIPCFVGLVALRSPFCK